MDPRVWGGIHPTTWQMDVDCTTRSTTGSSAGRDRTDAHPALVRDRRPARRCSRHRTDGRRDSTHSARRATTIFVATARGHDPSAATSATTRWSAATAGPFPDDDRTRLSNASRRQVATSTSEWCFGRTICIKPSQFIRRFGDRGPGRPSIASVVSAAGAQHAQDRAASETALVPPPAGATAASTARRSCSSSERAAATRASSALNRGNSSSIFRPTARGERDEHHAAVLRVLALRRTYRRPCSVVRTPLAVGRLIPTAAANSRASISPQIQSTQRAVNAVQDSRSSREHGRLQVAPERRAAPEDVGDRPHRPEVEREVPELLHDLAFGGQQAVGAHEDPFAILSPSSWATSRTASTSSSVVR